MRVTLSYPRRDGGKTHHMLSVEADSRERRDGQFAEFVVDGSATATLTLSESDCLKLATRFELAAEELAARREGRTTLAAKFRATHSAHVAESMERNEEHRASAVSDATPTEKKS